MFEQKYEKYQKYSSENFQFLEVIFSIYLNRRVFVMLACYVPLLHLFFVSASMFLFIYCFFHYLSLSLLPLVPWEGYAS